MKLKIILILILFTGATEQSHSQTSLTLEAALDLSLLANPSLLAAQAKTKAAKASVSQATGYFLPQLNLNAGYTKYQEPSTITPIHEIGVFPALDDEIYNANFNLKLPIFDGGRLMSKRNIAKASENENKAYKRLAEQSLMQQIAELFLFARQVDNQSDLMYKRLDVLYLRYQDILALESEGRVPPGDVALVASTLASAKADSIAVYISKNQIELRLGLLVGKFQPITPILSLVNDSSAEIIETYFDSDIIDTNIIGPILEATIARNQKSLAVSSLAKKSFWPEASLFGTYVYRSGSEWDPIGEWIAGIKLSLPIFQGGTRINKISEAKSMAFASGQAVLSAELEQKTYLQIALDDYRSNKTRYNLLIQAENEKIKSVVAQNELYKAGRIPLRDLNIQELELLQLQVDKNKLLFSARSALLRYFFITGTLSKEKTIKITGGLQ